MSTIKTNNVQLGQSVTATNNFTWYQPASPDGTVRLGNGNAGSVTDLVTLTSAGNLGIGTSSPTAQLTVVNAANSGTATDNCSVVVSSTNRTGFIRLDSVNGVNGNSSVIFSAGGTEQGRILYKADSNYMYFSTATVERMRLDSAGNLGLGVTPSGWSGIGSAIELKGNAYIASTTQVLSLCTNAYFNGTNFIYKSSSFANRYDTVFGEHRWYTAGSGTAGNAITFNQAMTLDASGNLGIGTSSPTAAGAGYVSLTLNGSTSSFMDLRSNNGGVGRIQADDANSFGISNIAGASGYTHFNTNGIERARITSAGDFLVGTTSVIALGLANFYSATNAKRCIETKINTAVASDHIAFFSSSGQAGQITVTGSTTAYGTGSDYRLKENIKPLQNALSRVALLKPSKYIWKADQSEGEGFIAHELQEVVPQAVTGEKDGEQMQGVDYGKLTPLLTAAIQELSAELNELKQKVNA